LRRRGYEIFQVQSPALRQVLRERLQSLKLASEQAKAIVEAAPDTEGAVNEALMRLVQEKLFVVLQDIQVDPDRLNLSGITRAVAELCRSSVTQKRWQAEAREQARKEAEAKLERSVTEAGAAAERERLSPREVLERSRPSTGARRERILLPYQRRWVDDKARFKIGMFARQTGKTFSTIRDRRRRRRTRHRRRTHPWVILSRGERQPGKPWMKGSSSTCGPWARPSSIWRRIPATVSRTAPASKPWK
jgi:hypothetical protein